MKRTILALGAAILTASFITSGFAPVHGQDPVGLPLPTPGAAPSDPSGTVAGRPQLWNEYPLEATAWRVAGRDSQHGDFTGSMTFTRAGRRYLRYERQISFGRGGQELERGEVAIKDGRLYLQASPPEVLSGLRHTFEGAAGAGAARRAIYRLDSEGLRLEGRYKLDASRSGEERLTPIPATGAGRDAVLLLVDGGEMFPSLKQALESARSSICLQTFIYTDDSTGRAVGRILMERARAGVKVRVLVDSIGNKMGKLEGDLRAAGVEVVLQHGWGEGIKNTVLDFGRGLWDGIKRLFGGKPKPREKRGVLNHDHRKIVVVDGRIGFTGGMNIAAEYEHDWHDIHARVVGPAAPALEAMFYDRWKAAGGKGAALPAVAGMADAAGTMDVDVVGSIPGISMAIRHRYLQEINGARQRVLIENAYFLDDQVIDAMQASVRRNVRTVLIVPPDHNHDLPIVRDAFLAVQNDVVRSGIELYKYRDRMVHSKVASFDGRVATVGSANLDPMALSLLSEVNLFVNDAGFARTVDTRIFARDIPMSDREVEKKLSWWEKVKSSTLHFFRAFI